MGRAESRPPIARSLVAFRQSRFASRVSPVAFRQCQSRFASRVSPVAFRQSRFAFRQSRFASRWSVRQPRVVSSAAGRFASRGSVGDQPRPGLADSVIDRPGAGPDGADPRGRRRSRIAVRTASRPVRERAGLVRTRSVLDAAVVVGRGGFVRLTATRPPDHQQGEHQRQAKHDQQPDGTGTHGPLNPNAQRRSRQVPFREIARATERRCCRRPCRRRSAASRRPSSARPCSGSGAPRPCGSRP